MINPIKSFLYKIYLLFPYASGQAKIYFCGEEKSFLQRFIELASWLLRDSQFNRNYYAFGLNLKSSNQKHYMGRKEFLALKNKAEHQLRKAGGLAGLSYDVITKDKFIANAFFVANKIPCIPVTGLVSEGNIFYNDGKVKDLDALFETDSPFVLKNVVLEAGDGFMLCTPKHGKLLIGDNLIDLNGIKRKISSFKWIIQQRITSHAAIRKVNATALNTTRIVTIRSGSGECAFLAGFQAFATGNGEIDSWGRGSVYVGFDYRQNLLTGPGYYHPGIKGPGTTVRHPDSQIEFDGYHIPFLQESVSLCLKAHRLLYNHFVIGWDVAITDNGPLIVEANEKPGMNAVQCIDGGLRYKIKRYFDDL